MGKFITAAVVAAGMLLATNGVSYAQLAARQVQAESLAMDARLNACAARHGGSMRPCVFADPVCIAKYGSAEACITGVLANHQKLLDKLAATEQYRAAYNKRISAETAARQAKAVADEQWLRDMQAETRAIDAQTELDRLRDRIRMNDGYTHDCWSTAYRGFVC